MFLVLLHSWVGGILVGPWLNCEVSNKIVATVKCKSLAKYRLNLKTKGSTEFITPKALGCSARA